MQPQSTIPAESTQNDTCDANVLMRRCGAYASTWYLLGRGDDVALCVAHDESLHASGDVMLAPGFDAAAYAFLSDFGRSIARVPKGDTILDRSL